MSQQPDTKPGFYYVSVIHGAKVLMALGPFVNNHALALEMVPIVEKHVDAMNDPKAPWYAYGTCRADDDQGPGKLNAALGFNAPHI